ncbi:MAG: imidazoleglycerol-phosphate dehydratase HisB [Clostridiales bacterium]|nr:imidazoleglycerol-phosphate dehydratase HisB [Clostridiales bacterium]
MRTKTIKRTTNETDISLTLNLDGTGQAQIESGCGFLDHMLTLFARHGRFDLSLSCKGDTDVDFHHTVEDIGICMGEALASALGDKRGICRYAQQLLPMDEALVLLAVDLCGRSYLGYRVTGLKERVGTFDTELAEEFLLALTRSAGITLHVQMLSGCNTHHMIEAVFKALGRALKDAVKIDETCRDEIPSTKGVL